MEETQNKKRRNLMLTTVAVIVAAFLGLKLPALGSLIQNSSDPASATWKVWAVAGAFVLYQFWRWTTDTETRQEYGRVSKVYADNYYEQARRRLTREVRKQLLGQSSRFILRTVSELPEGDDWNWRRASLDVSHYSDGKHVPIDTAGETVVGFQVHSSDKSRSVSSSFSLEYSASRESTVLCHLRAAARTLWHSPDCQDVAVPWFLTPVALWICSCKVAMLMNAA